MNILAEGYLDPASLVNNLAATAIWAAAAFIVFRAYRLIRRYHEFFTTMAADTAKSMMDTLLSCKESPRHVVIAIAFQQSQMRELDRRDNLTISLSVAAVICGLQFFHEPFGVLGMAANGLFCAGITSLGATLYFRRRLDLFEKAFRKGLSGLISSGEIAAQIPDEAHG